MLPELKAPVNPSSPGSPPPRDPAYLPALGVPDTVPSSGEPTGEPVLSIQGQMSTAPTPEAREPRREDLLASATPAGQPGAKLPTSALRELVRRGIFKRFAFTQYERQARSREKENSLFPFSSRPWAVVLHDAVLTRAILQCPGPTGTCPLTARGQGARQTSDTGTCDVVSASLGPSAVTRAPLG